MRHSGRNAPAAQLSERLLHLCRPNEFDPAFQPLHQIAIPHRELFLSEMWDLDGLVVACSERGGGATSACWRGHSPHHRAGRLTGKRNRRGSNPGPPLSGALVGW